MFLRPSDPKAAANTQQGHRKMMDGKCFVKVCKIVRSSPFVNSSRCDNHFSRLPRNQSRRENDLYECTSGTTHESTSGAQATCLHPTV